MSIAAAKFKSLSPIAWLAVSCCCRNFNQCAHLPLPHLLLCSTFDANCLSSVSYPPVNSLCVWIRDGNNHNKIKIHNVKFLFLFCNSPFEWNIISDFFLLWAKFLCWQCLSYLSKLSHAGGTPVIKRTMVIQNRVHRFVLKSLDCWGSQLWRHKTTGTTGSFLYLELLLFKKYTHIYRPLMFSV